MTDGSAPAPPSIQRQLKAAGLVALGLAAVLGALYLVYVFTAGGPVLSGPHDHDFGTIELGDAPVKLEHAFVLTNRTDRTVQVQDFRTSCSCTEASVSTRSIEPGGEVEVKAVITMTGDGRKTATVTLLMGEDVTETLHVAAAARLRRRLAVPAEDAPLEPGRTIHRTLKYSDYDSNAEPPPPALSPPEGVTVTAGPWKPFGKRQPSQVRPAMWQVDLTITQTAPELLPVGSSITIRVGDDQRFDLPIVRP